MKDLSTTTIDKTGNINTDFAIDLLRSNKYILEQGLADIDKANHNMCHAQKIKGMIASIDRQLKLNESCRG